MSLPRQVLPGTTYLITRRVAQRQFLLTPGPTVNQVLRYCLHRAALRHGVELHAVQVLSNHLHLIATDVRGQLPEFMAWLDRESAKCLNELYDRSEALWSSDHYSAVVLFDAESVLDKLVYVFVNCVTAGLVRCHRDWPGVGSRPRDWLGPSVTVQRPKLHFSDREDDWAEIEVCYSVPPALRDKPCETLVAELERMVAERERELGTEARRRGRAFLGADRVKKQSPFAAPASAKPKGKLSPTFAAGTAAGQKRARLMLRHFRAAYREALGKWRAGAACVFPCGTYWLACFAGVCCAGIETALPALDSA